MLRSFRVVCLAILLWLAAPAAVLAQSSVSIYDLPILLPTRTIALDGNDGVRSVAFGIDEGTLYVQRGELAFNVWAVGVYFWPEIASGVGALLALMLLRSSIRVARRPQIAGMPHCRACNYCLTGCDGERCPECGGPAQRPVRGRSLRRRLVPRLALLGVVLAGGITPWVLPQRPRVGRVQNWVGWWSTSLEEWTRRYGRAAWRQCSAAVVTRIDAVDVPSGRRRVLCRGRPKFQDLVVTPTGDLLLPFADGASLVDAHSGRTRRSLRWWSVGRCSAPSVFVGFSPDGREAWLRYLDEGRMKQQLRAWDLVSGRQRVIAEDDAWRND